MDKSDNFKGIVQGYNITKMELVGITFVLVFPLHFCEVFYHVIFGSKDCHSKIFKFT